MNLSMIYTYREETVAIRRLWSSNNDLQLRLLVRVQVYREERPRYVSVYQNDIFICKSNRVHWLFETIFFEILQVPYVVVLL